MDLEADIIEFRVPTENNKTIFIWEIQITFTEAYIYESLWSVYSAFGALYLVKVCPNATVAAPGFYALVKFYSAAHASKAQRATDKQCLFQDVPVKVRLSTKQNPSFLFASQSLSHAKCQDLANHYLGYNGWSTRIITVKDISKCADAGSQGELLKYSCMVELTLPQHGVMCCGVGVVEEVVDHEKRMGIRQAIMSVWAAVRPVASLPCHQALALWISSAGDATTAPHMAVDRKRGEASAYVGPEEKLWLRGKLMKWAKDKAVVAAFEKLLLIVLGNGKVAVECRIDREETLADETVEAVIRVNDVTWSDFDAAAGEEDDLPWNFTMDLSH